MKKWSRKMLAVLAGLVVVIVVALFWFVYNSLLVLPVNDKDLLPVRRSIPEAKNAAPLIIEAAERLQEPKSSELGFVTVSFVWDEPVYGELVKDSEEAFELADRALARPETEFPAEFPPALYAGLQNLTYLRMVRARWHRMHRQGKAALDELMKGIELTDRIEYEGDVTLYVVASSGKLACCRAFVEMLGDSTLTAEQLSSYISRLRKYEADKKGMAKVLGADYASCVSIFEKLLNASPEELEREGLAPGKYSEGYYFNLNATKKILAELHRDAIRNIPLPYAEQDLQKVELPDTDTLAGKIKAALTPNLEGRAIARMTSLKGFLREKCRENTHVRATQAAIAVRCYELENGCLPDYLEQLVPKYLDRIPEDDFNGEPLRYDLDKRLIYSVGSNLKDDGGKDRDDIVVHLEF